MKFNEQLKDAIDPNGILAASKSGIWPQRYREGRQNGSIAPHSGAEGSHLAAKLDTTL